MNNPREYENPEGGRGSVGPSRHRRNDYPPQPVGYGQGNDRPQYFDQYGGSLGRGVYSTLPQGGTEQENYRQPAQGTTYQTEYGSSSQTTRGAIDNSGQTSQSSSHLDRNTVSQNRQNERWPQPDRQLAPREDKLHVSEELQLRVHRRVQKKLNNQEEERQKRERELDNMERERLEGERERMELKRRKKEIKNLDLGEEGWAYVRF